MEKGCRTFTQDPFRLEGTFVKGGDIEDSRIYDF